MPVVAVGLTGAHLTDLARSADGLDAQEADMAVGGNIFFGFGRGGAASARCKDDEHRHYGDDKDDVSFHFSPT